MNMLLFLSMVVLISIHGIPANTTCVLTNGIDYALPAGSLNPVSISFSPGGTLLATANFGVILNSVSLFSVKDGGLSNGVNYATGDGARSVSFSPNGKLLVIANYDSNSLSVYRVTDNYLTNRSDYLLPVGGRGPNSVAFSPDGSLLATANELISPQGFHTVSVFNVTVNGLNGGVNYNLVNGMGHPDSLVFSPNGKLLGIAEFGLSPSPGGLAVFNVTVGGLSGGDGYVLLPQGATSAYSVAFSPNGKLVATANANFGNNISLFKVIGISFRDGVNYALPIGGKSPVSVAFSPDGQLLVTANQSSNDVSLFNVTVAGLDGGTNYLAGNQPSFVVFSPRGQLLAVANRGVTLFNVVCNI